MKALKVIGVLGAVAVVVVVTLAAVAVGYVNRLVQSPEFKQQLVATASRAVGAPVEIQRLNVSLWRGIELHGVKIGNPDGFAGELLTAEAFRLRYRLWALLRRRVEVATLTLERPVITLARNARGEWNYEKLGARAEAAGAKTDRRGAAHVSGFDVALQNVSLQQATMVMVRADGGLLLRLGDAEMTTIVELSGGQPSGAGQARVAEVNCAGRLFVRDVTGPLRITSEAIRLAPLTGTMAGGVVSGEAALSLRGDSQYRLQLQVRDADVATVLKEAGVARAVLTGGKLQLTTALTGSGGLETVVGGGRAQVRGGQLVEIPILNLVATLLQTGALRHLQLEELVVDYTLSNQVLQTPLIRVVSPQVQLLGKGRMTLEDYQLDHQMTLVLGAPMMDKVPKEIRNVFARREDGSFAIDFHVSGPYDAPKTDLQQRLIGGAAGQILQRLLK
jgi:hypothetical protein